MNGRRRILTGLSAAGVAAALPSFAFLGTARADDVEFRGRLRRRALTDDGLEFRLLIRASARVTLPHLTHVQAQLEYPDGQRVSADVEVERPPRPGGWVRRGPPPAPDITLRAGRETRFGRFYIRPVDARNVEATVHFDITIGRNRPIVVPAVTILA